MKKLSNYRDLYEYLLSLSLALKGRGLSDLAQAVEFAVAHASMVTSEFPGESRFALRRILTEERGTLTSQQRADMEDVVRQLDEWFFNR